MKSTLRPISLTGSELGEARHVCAFFKSREDEYAESGGRVSGPSGAARKLGIPGSTLDSKIRSLGIHKSRFMES